MSSPTFTAPTNLRRAISNTIKGSAGNLVEWFDVYVYTVFAIYFEHHFFDPADKNSNVYVWAIFAVTFLMRPIGSWWFGRFADRHGRRAALTLSVTVMATCSFVIALIPTREVFGVGAAVVLVLCRLVQGFATGGEYGTSATYMAEAATKDRRGFLSSFHYVTLVGGHVLAQLTLFLMLTLGDKAFVADYGWRIAFAMGGIAAVVVFWLRRTMDESLSDEELEKVREGKDPAAGSLGELFGKYGRELTLCIVVTMGGTVAFYTYSVNAPKIVQSTFAGSDAVTGTLINLVALGILAAMQPIGGLISDKVGRKSLLVFFGIGGVVYTYFFLTWLRGLHSPVLAFLLLIIGFIILTGYTSINAVVKAAMFPRHIRALGVGLGYAIANSLFGGTAPVLYQAAKDHSMVPLFLGYVIVLIAISLVVYVRYLSNHGKQWLDDEPELARAKEAGEPMGKLGS